MLQLAGIFLNILVPVFALVAVGYLAGPRLGLEARVALRVNPPFALKGSGMKMGGAASPFGVDAADAVSGRHLSPG